MAICIVINICEQENLLIRKRNNWFLNYILNSTIFFIILDSRKLLISLFSFFENKSISIANHFREIKILPDKTRTYVPWINCLDISLTLRHIFECPALAMHVLKLGMVSLEQRLYTKTDGTLPTKPTNKYSSATDGGKTNHSDWLKL